VDRRAIELIKPGVSTDESPTGSRSATEFGFENEMEAFGLQFGHGLGLGLHERPIISRVNSFDQNPMEIKEAWCSRSRPTARPATACPPPHRGGGRGDRRRRDVITLFPAEELRSPTSTERTAAMTAMPPTRSTGTTHRCSTPPVNEPIAGAIDPAKRIAHVR
jgi:hypothetical protein